VEDDSLSGFLMVLIRRLTSTPSRESQGWTAEWFRGDAAVRVLMQIQLLQLTTGSIQNGHPPKAKSRKRHMQAVRLFCAISVDDVGEVEPQLSLGK
jgi:hypothetical protein